MTPYNLKVACDVWKHFVFSSENGKTVSEDEAFLQYNRSHLFCEVDCFTSNG